MAREHMKNLIRENCKLDEATGCWNWTGRIINTGYGRVQIVGVGSYLAHRFSYEAFHGDIPAKMSICHKCDNRLCVNPEHLYAGTHSDNMRDMYDKNRHPALNFLSNEQVLEARELRHTHGLSYEAIGDKFGVSNDTARSAILGLRKCYAIT